MYGYGSDRFLSLKIIGVFNTTICENNTVISKSNPGTKVNGKIRAPRSMPPMPDERHPTQLLEDVDSRVASSAKKKHLSTLKARWRCANNHEFEQYLSNIRRREGVLCRKALSLLCILFQLPYFVLFLYISVILTLLCIMYHVSLT